MGTSLQDMPSTMHPCQAELAQQRILFLGNQYNPLSVACLEGLSKLGCELLVGMFNPLNRGLWPTVSRSIRVRGWKFLAFKAMRISVCKSSAALRSLRFPLRGFQSLPELCGALGLRLVPMDKPNSPTTLEQLRLLQLDLIVVAAFSCILKKELLQLPRLGCINVHPSLLPRYRGPNPCYWVVAEGEKVSGVTIHYMDEGVDTGDIILQRPMPLLRNDTERKVRSRSGVVAAEMLREVVPALVAGTAARIKQDESAASYYSIPPKGASIL
jgi:hypothetical protein